jgi:hypothetical protein
MKRLLIMLTLALFASLFLFSAVSAQGEALELTLSRDWGYGGFNNDIQGTFSMKVKGPSDLVRVEFFIDETRIGEAVSAPFNLQFVTDNYPPGIHSLSAVGTTSGGQVLTSNIITANFVTKEDSSRAGWTFILPILALVFGALILAAVVPLITGRKTVHLAPGTPRKYVLGGAICPRCKRPFALHLYGLNLVGGKLDRCPYCGKWSLARRASMERLLQAEQAELENASPQVPQLSAEEKLNKELEDSKYQNQV